MVGRASVVVNVVVFVIVAVVVNVRPSVRSLFVKCSVCLKLTVMRLPLLPLVIVVLERLMQWFSNLTCSGRSPLAADPAKHASLVRIPLR